MGKSVDWLDVYNIGPQLVRRGILELAVPGVILPPPKPRSRRDSRSRSSPLPSYASSSSPAPPSPFAEDEATGSVGAHRMDAESAFEGDEDISQEQALGWHARIMTKEEAKKRGILIRRDQVLPSFIARMVLWEMDRPRGGAEQRKNSCFLRRRYGGATWKRATDSDIEPVWDQVDDEADSAAGRGAPAGWPWHPKWWKPTPDDRIRELAKAGALIAAEIDRLQRMERSK